MRADAGLARFQRHFTEFEIAIAVAKWDTDHRSERDHRLRLDAGNGAPQIGGQHGIRDPFHPCVRMRSGIGLVALRRQQRDPLPTQHAQVLVRHAPCILHAPSSQYREQRRKGELERKDDTPDPPFATRAAHLHRAGSLLPACQQPGMHQHLDQDHRHDQRKRRDQQMRPMQHSPDARPRRRHQREPAHGGDGVPRDHESRDQQRTGDQQTHQCSKQRPIQ
ncbi:MAG: hypothetical protein ACYCZI_06990, partial [Metallibacterium scheffleri]